MNNLLNPNNYIYDPILFNIAETQTQKAIKKVLFIIISTIIPLLEIIGLAFQTIDNFKNDSNPEIIISTKTFILLFTLISLICTWAMVSSCYLKIKNIIFMLILKLISIFTILVMISDNENFNYNLVFNILSYGIFYTLVILYKMFPKGVI